MLRHYEFTQRKTCRVRHIHECATTKKNGGIWLNDWCNTTAYEMGITPVAQAGWVENNNTCTIVPVGSLTQVHAAFNVNKSLDFELVEGDYLLINGLVVELDTQYQDWYGCGRRPDDHFDATRPTPQYIPSGFVGGCHDRINGKVEFDAAGLTTFSFDAASSGSSGCDITGDVNVSAR